MGKASRLVDVAIEPSEQTHEGIQLDGGASVRCTLVNVPDGTEQVELILFFGKQDTPAGVLSDIQYLLDQPVAQTRLTGSRKVTLDRVSPGVYTLLAYPVNSDHRKGGAYRISDALLATPVYMDTFTLREGVQSTTIAAAFPGETPRQLANTPTHPVVGQWVYPYKGSTWMRTFTRDGRCILSEGGVFAWENPYIILGTRRVAVIIGNSKRIHMVREDDRLEVEGKFVATRVVR
ncbi:MAG: hypothetical protein L3K26_07915 [Candidatus Hydrogenedentes bacterium]|nr:hypothetical protein [Candidatus Hydrogenedentota bacterium]